MRILLTGASGFVGRHLLKELQKTSHEMIILHRGNNTSGEQDYSNDKYIDLRRADWSVLVGEAKPDLVLHLAAYLTSADDDNSINQLIESNIVFGTKLLSALKDTSFKYFIHTGTFAEYHTNGRDITPAYLYAAMKTAFRPILSYYQALSNFKTINVIPFTIYGGLDSKKKLIDYIYLSISNESAIKMSPGEQVLDFIHIDDVVSFYLALIAQINKFGQQYTEIRLGTGIGTTPKQLAGLMEKATGRKTNIEWGGLPYRQRDTMYSVADLDLPSEYISWQPQKSIEQGIEDYINIIEKK